MKALIQRVKFATVKVDSEPISSIGEGLLVFLGITNNDGEAEIDYLVNKIVRLRIFDDDEGIMNRSVFDIRGEILVVSQFTLCARTKKGNRPSYIDAAKGPISEPLYERFCAALGELLGQDVQRGKFGADMEVELLNEGPVTIMIDTEENIQ